MDKSMICNKTEWMRSLTDLREMGENLTHYALLYVDIKSFHTVNELFGFEEGDRLLHDTVMHFASSPLKPALCCHLVADRFVFLVKIEHICYDTLQEGLQFDWKVRNEEFPVHLTCGVYPITDQEELVADMLDKAVLAQHWVGIQSEKKLCYLR